MEACLVYILSCTQKIKKRKILKPQQDKFVKDKLLHEIFQEIADENAEAGSTGYQEEKNIDYSKQLSKKRTIQKIRQRIIIAMLVILIIFVLFSPNDEADSTDLLDSKQSMYSIPKANQITTEEEQRETDEAGKEALVKEVLAKEEPMIKTSETKMMPDTKIIPKVNTRNTPIPNVQEPRTEREKAKALLRQQLQN